MVLCKIKKCLKFNTYLLEIKKEIDCNACEKLTELQIEFYGIDQPKENAYLLLNEKLLDRNSTEFTQPYSFELYENKPTKEELNSGEFAVLKIDSKNIVLKRIYG